MQNTVAVLHTFVCPLTLPRPTWKQALKDYLTQSLEALKGCKGRSCILDDVAALDQALKSAALQRAQ